MSKGSMRVPFGAMTITQTAKDLIAEALDGERLSSGKLVRRLEERFAELTGVKEAVAVSSGTDADALALAVLHDFGASRGDEVIVPALSFVATGNAVLQAGFEPVFVDIERHTLNIDPTRVESAITDRTVAIMPVHLMGKPAEMDTINAIARKHKLYVIEDAAEAHGATYKGRTIGTLGDMARASAASLPLWNTSRYDATGLAVRWLMRSAISCHEAWPGRPRRMAHCALNQASNAAKVTRCAPAA